MVYPPAPSLVHICQPFAIIDSAALARLAPPCKALKQALWFLGPRKALAESWHLPAREWSYDIHIAAPLLYMLNIGQTTVCFQIMCSVIFYSVDHNDKSSQDNMRVEHERPIWDVRNSYEGCLLRNSGSFIRTSANQQGNKHLNHQTETG